MNLIDIANRPALDGGGPVQRIPKRIVQTFETRSVPSGMYAAVQTWLSHNPDYDYCFFDRDERRGLIEESFEPSVLRAYDKLELGALRADLWRYCTLFLNGGVYADIDFVSFAPLCEVLRPDDEFVTANAHAPKQALVNGFIAAVPEHPFLSAAIERAVRNILESPTKRPMAMTGPVCFGEAVNLALGRDPAFGFEDGDQTHADFVFRLLAKAHAKEQRDHRIVDGSRTLFLCKYAGYENDLKAVGLVHWQKRIAQERRGEFAHWFGVVARKIRGLSQRLTDRRSGTRRKEVI